MVGWMDGRALPSILPSLWTKRYRRALPRARPEWMGLGSPIRALLLYNILLILALVTINLFPAGPRQDSLPSLIFFNWNFEGRLSAIALMDG